MSTPPEVVGTKAKQLAANLILQVELLVCRDRSNLIGAWTFCFSSLFVPLAEGNILQPEAKKRSHEMNIHGEKRIDPYHWLRYKDDPDVIRYLEAENDYAEQYFSEHQDLESTLFAELKSRLPKIKKTFPYYDNGYLYYSEISSGQDYPTYYRKKFHDSGKGQVLIDTNRLAENKDYFKLSHYSVSPNNRILAYSEDRNGDRVNTIFFKNLVSEKVYNNKILSVSDNFVWANDSQTLFYVKRDFETLRRKYVYSYSLTTDKHQLVFEEKNNEFSVYVSKSKTGNYIFIGSFATDTSEYRYIKSDRPKGEFKVFSKRKQGIEYQVEDGGSVFLIKSNKDQSINYKISYTSKKETRSEYWQDLIPHRVDTYVKDYEVFKDYIVLHNIKKGAASFQVFDRRKQTSNPIAFDGNAFMVEPYINRDYYTTQFSYSYESLSIPETIYEYDMQVGANRIVDQQDVGIDYIPNDYISERIYAEGSNGEFIPVSLVYKKNLKRDQGNPTIVYGYGSYGYTVNPSFNVNRMSLLDRGFVFAIAHVRGGSMLGRPWYQNGKLLKKMNTFNDFIASAEHLVRSGYADPTKLYAIGGSAGGLLVGAVMNLRPELFDGVIAAVPFVDVVNTMLDESIPLVTGEFNEWGNPKEKTFYDYMMKYSPYDNVQNLDYPNLFVTTGLHDTQVPYWEPAKWVAKLRALNKGTNKILLQTDMASGHGGASGVDQSLKELAREYAFLIMLSNKQ